MTGSVRPSLKLRDDETGGYLAYCWEDNGDIYVMHIYVPEHCRMRGGATRLMLRVFEIADYYGADTTLICSADHGPGPRNETLRRIYERMGFRSGEKTYMRRRPAAFSLSPGDGRGYSPCSDTEERKQST